MHIHICSRTFTHFLLQKLERSSQASDHWCMKKIDVFTFFWLEMFSFRSKKSLCVKGLSYNITTVRNGSVYSNFWNVHFLPSGKQTFT